VISAIGTTELKDKNMHNKFMQRAIELSIENVKTNKGGPFGVVIVKNDEIIAQGTNLVTSTNDPTAHAEIVAIRSACNTLQRFHIPDCVMYTSCEPCPMCLSACYWAHIKTIYYGNTKQDAATIDFDDSFIYEQLSIEYDKRLIPMKNIMRQKATEAFDLWKEKQDKIEY